MILAKESKPFIPAEVHLKGGFRIVVSIQEPKSLQAEFTIDPPDIVSVSNETYQNLPVYSPGNGFKNERLRPLIADECCTKGALDPETLVVRAGPGPGDAVFKPGADYNPDLAWGMFGRTADGKIGAEQKVYVSYQYVKLRLDSAVLTADGKIILKRGEPDVRLPQPPALAPGETRLANIFISGRLKALGEDNLFPVLETAYPEKPKTRPTQAERWLPKTMAKLQDGEPLKILSWGDSITAATKFQVLFVKGLKARYPRANITLITEGWGGHNTDDFLKAAPGALHCYREKVLDQKPDLIIVEFFNDQGFPLPKLEERYTRLQKDFLAIGAEMILVTPLYPRPDSMGFTRNRDVNDDPRPYTKFLRDFAPEHQIPLADASLRYGRLWRQGIPVITILSNQINHPTMQGHQMFADSLLELFP
jgi:lysophospholipase L1-like esterase